MKIVGCVYVITISFCLAFLSTTATGQATTTPSDAIPVSKRAKAPNFAVNDVNGRPFVLAKLKGRVVLLDFWAIACGGCKLELPWYVSFDQRYKGKGLSLGGLDMYGETPEAVKSFAAAHQMQYSLAIGTDAIGDLYHLREMPLTVLIDRKGRIAVSHSGIVDPKVFESDIKVLLAE